MGLVRHRAFRQANYRLLVNAEFGFPIDHRDSSRHLGLARNFNIVSRPVRISSKANVCSRRGS